MRKDRFVVALFVMLTLSAFSMNDTARQAPGHDQPPGVQPSPRQPGVAATQGTQGRAGSPLFDRLDADKDGYISTREADIFLTVKDHFKTMDTDKDGRISAREWSEFQGR